MLISYAMYLKIYFIKHKTDLFLNIIQFCENKEKRYSKNNDLYIFLNKQKNLSFIEGKNKFYNKDFEKK